MNAAFPVPEKLFIGRPPDSPKAGHLLFSNWANDIAFPDIVILDEESIMHVISSDSGWNGQWSLPAWKR